MIDTDIVRVEKTKDALALIAGGKEKVRCHNLIERIRSKSGLTSVEIKLALKSMVKEGVIECELYRGEPVSSVKVKLPVPERIRLKQAWQDAVDRQGFQDGSEKRLRAKPVLLDGRSHDEVVSAFARILEFKECDIFLRELSSKVFWGQSKILDDKAHLIAELLGVDSCPFLEKPISLNIHIPQKQVTGVLFIENEVSFLVACKNKIKGAESLIIVFSSGYKGGAPRIRERGCTKLFFSTDSVHFNHVISDFNDWLFDDAINLNTYFWGDLDFSGMGILASLRKVFPNAKAWETGYEPMLATVNAGGGHSPTEAKKDRQYDPCVTGCDYADDVLLPALRRAGKFLDQE